MPDLCDLRQLSRHKSYNYLVRSLAPAISGGTALSLMNKLHPQLAFLSQAVQQCLAYYVRSNAF